VDYLAATDIIDWIHPEVSDLAGKLRHPDDTVATAKACFEWVRDQIRHSHDHQQNPTTCRASDVLRHGTGYCYAKSHLLAALLRANGIRTGFCYQRLSVNDQGPPFCLHGLNAVELPGYGWYRVDARGNRTGVDAQFTPPVERLAFSLQCTDEFEFDNIFADPLPCVVDVLTKFPDWKVVWSYLPDVAPEEFAKQGLIVRPPQADRSRRVMGSE
jgi:transglutaminase-like putative cysteine protease